MAKKKSNSFELLLNAAKKCRHEMWQFIQVLFWVTFGLVIIFYIVEARAQPKEYGNPIWAVIWVFTQYIDDPGDFAGPRPVTTVGRLVATVIGIIKILIFATPAGMIGSRFSEELKEDSKKKEKKVNLGKIFACFKREQCRHTYYRCLPPYLSLVSLQIQLNLSSEDIIAAIKFSQENKVTEETLEQGLRLRNLADTYTDDKESQDKLVVELFPLAGKAQDGVTMEKTKYGCKINRKSKVTIVATSSYDLAEIGDSHFAYYLALYGGFNYVSREFGEKGSYYTVSTDTEENDDVFKTFKTDLETLSGNSSDAWTIFILQVPRNLRSQFCFVHKIREKQQDILDIKTTVREENESLFVSTFEQVKNMLEHGGDNGTCGYKYNSAETESDTPLTADLDDSFGGVGKRNIGTLINAGNAINAFTIRIASKIIVRDRRNIPIAAKMAEIFRTSFESEKTYDVEAQEKMRKAKGAGYVIPREDNYV